MLQKVQLNFCVSCMSQVVQTHNFPSWSTMPEIMEEQDKSVSQILRTNKILQKVEAEMALLKTRKSISFFPIS